MSYQYCEIKSKKKLGKCPKCGKSGKIMDYVRSDGKIDGIGYVGCDCEGSKSFCYSGKCGFSKLEAIGAWNSYCQVLIDFYRQED